EAKSERMKLKNIIFISLVFLSVLSCREEVPAPVIVAVSPNFGPAETLVTFEGMNLQSIKQIAFSDQVINFNTAYNSENALLLRIPTNVPLGEHEVSITTAGGTTSTNFRVTLDPPEVFSFAPESAAVGEAVTIKGKNFFDPLSVYFFDSIQANIVTATPDSIIAIVPPGVEKGRITVDANGGATRSPINFFTVKPILVNDFDGNGLRAETSKWIFVGSINQNSNNAIQSADPEPINGNFLKLSGRDDLGINWIGGAENHSWDTDQFQTFGITTDANNTLVEMDIHNNGRDNTNIILVLLEREGSTNDFTHQIKVDWDGWQRISIPLNRFQDLNDFIVDPTKIRTLKIHLIDAEDSNESLEVNVDNIRFIEIL
ncbi:MAG: glycan-binding surface protein, partial [Bacteroidota bacterium]